MHARSMFVSAIVFHLIVLAIAPPAGAESCHWVDRGGFHSVNSIALVPLQHRKELPMARNRTALPFTEEENRDGSMYVWFMLGQAGYDYPYTKSADIPRSPVFSPMSSPQEGDVAWWSGFVALYRAKDGMLLTARGVQPLKSLVKKRGPPLWYRYTGALSADTTPQKKASPKALKAADAALAGLERAAVFPPQIEDEAEQEHLTKKWREAVVRLETLRKKFPDDPQVLWRVGEAFRIGRNLDVAGAWERAEAYLLRAEVLGPLIPDAYLALGAHYADTDITFGEIAERQFRQALPLARNEQLPQVWWGITVALYYQGKKAEAASAVDRLLALRPRDGRALRLQATILGVDEEK